MKEVQADSAPLFLVGSKSGPVAFGRLRKSGECKAREQGMARAAGFTGIRARDGVEMNGENRSPKDNQI